MEHEQDYTHVSEHLTRQMRYTSDQLYKFGNTSTSGGSPHGFTLPQMRTSDEMLNLCVQEALFPPHSEHFSPIKFYLILKFIHCGMMFHRFDPSTPNFKAKLRVKG